MQFVLVSYDLLFLYLVTLSALKRLVLRVVNFLKVLCCRKFSENLFRKLLEILVTAKFLFELASFFPVNTVIC